MIFEVPWSGCWWRGQPWWRGVVRFDKFALCDTFINFKVSCRVGRTCSLLIPSLITTQDTVLIIITILVIIHVQYVVITISTIGLISCQLVITPGVFNS